MNRPQDVDARPAPGADPPPPPAAPLPSIDDSRKGDRKAMARFVDLHSDAVYRFLHHRLDRREALEDLVQEVFLAAWTSLPRFRGESEVRTWLLSIARHKLGDHYRTRLRGLDLPQEHDAESEADAPSTFDVDGQIDAAKLEERTRRTLANLPDSYRAVLVWRYWDERPIAEMAAITGHTEKSIERLLDRARKLFKRRWRND